MDPMSRLLFDFQEMLNEIDAFSNLASKFLDPSSYYALQELQRSLNTYRNQDTTKSTYWGIPLGNPLKTIISEGQYERGARHGKRHIHATVSSTWNIQREPPKKKQKPATQFRLIGIASTKVKLIERKGDEEVEVAMWRMEAGDTGSPGCHFHVQIMGEKEDHPFPKSVPVPRLPGLLLTPMSVAEFVLAELFQDEWAEHASHDSAHLQRWIPIQRHRLGAVLQWHLATIQKGGSPWSTLKGTKPAEDIFV